jgi:hypothetical protein
MDSCPCWGKTKIIVELEHCPSLNGLLRTEVDKLINFTNQQTDFHRLGKVHISLVEAPRISAL